MKSSRPLCRRFFGSLAGSLLAFTAAPLAHATEMITFPSGSLIIPMDIATTGQDSGMLRAYGLVYDLLRHGVPVHWTINPDKDVNGDDFVLPGAAGMGLQNVKSAQPLTLPRSYRGGPFVVSAADAAAALPRILAWQAASGDATMVHRLTAGSFTVPVERILLHAPAIAILKDGNETIAFNNLNAAGIPDSTGASWNAASPGALSEAAIAGPTTNSAADGALFRSPGQARYGFIAAMHYSPSATTDEVVREVRLWLEGRPHTHAFLQCVSITTFENTSSGAFLTTEGLQDDGSTPTFPWVRSPGHPLAQINGAFTADTGSVDSIRAASPGTYHAGVTTIINEGIPLTLRISLLTGTMDGFPAANGMVTCLAGHDYSVSLPVSSNPQTNGVRIFLNALFFSGTALEQEPVLSNPLKTSLSFQFNLSGTTGSVYQIQMSGNLKDWSNWQTVVAPAGPLQVKDFSPPATEGRYFRAFLAPPH